MSVEWLALQSGHTREPATFFPAWCSTPPEPSEGRRLVRRRSKPGLPGAKMNKSRGRARTRPPTSPAEPPPVRV